MICDFVTHTGNALALMVKRSGLVCLCFFVTFLAGSGETAAAVWQSVRFPTPGFNADGFTCTISFLSQDTVGYLPLRIRAASPRGTFSGDRRLRLRVTPESGANWPTPQTEYFIEFDLEANTSVFDQTYYLPKYFEGLALTFDLADVDGPLPGYQRSVAGNTRQLHSQQLSTQDIRKHFAVITQPRSKWSSPAAQAWEEFPDLRTLDSMVALDNRYLSQRGVTRLDRNAALRYLESESTQCTQVLPLDEAHETWLGYESTDVILIAFPLLEEMRAAHPERYEAIRKWVSSGGTLWTFAAPASDELASFFNVVPFDFTQEDSSSLQAVASSKYDIAKVYDSSRDTAEWVALLNSNVLNSNRFNPLPSSVVQQQLKSLNHPVIENTTAEELAEQTDVLRVEAGKVVGIHLDDPFPGSWRFWYTVEYLSARNQIWQFRRGTSAVHGSSNFWDWLLEKVARPPIYPFLGVLTVFALLVGPVAYYLTRKAGRTYLMFLIAPVLATVATLSLFGYGFVADGFGTHCRLRQITWSDGRSQRATTMSRASYFTAFYKREGLAFPDDVAVYPMVDPLSAFQRQQENQSRIQSAIQIDGEQQRFQGEYFPARNQRQFLSFDPNTESASLQVSDGGESVLQLTNKFQQTVQRIIYHSPDGQYWEMEGEPCPPGASVRLKRIEAGEHQRMLRNLYRDTRPAPPPGYVVNQNSYRYQQWVTRLQAAQRFQDARWKEANDASGVFEAFLQNMLVNKTELPAGWYVAIADIDQRGLAYADADLDDSVHFIMGSAE